MKDYEISKTAGACCRCRKELAADEEFVATVTDAQKELQREDFCLACWQEAQGQDQPQVLGHWQSRMRSPAEKKKLFVDDNLLINFFERLADAQEPSKINFRFVLALVLMRKKLLIYDGSETSPEGQDLWTMRLRQTQQTYRVVDPHMDEDKIAEVSRHLGEILEADL